MKSLLSCFAFMSNSSLVSFSVLSFRNVCFNLIYSTTASSLVGLLMGSFFSAVCFKLGSKFSAIFPVTVANLFSALGLVLGSGSVWAHLLNQWMYCCHENNVKCLLICYLGQGADVCCSAVSDASDIVAARWSNGWWCVPLWHLCNILKGQSSQYVLIRWNFFIWVYVLYCFHL